MNQTMRMLNRTNVRDRIGKALICGLLLLLSACHDEKDPDFIIDLSGESTPTSDLPGDPGNGDRDPSAEVNTDTKISSLTVSLGTFNVAFAPRIKDYLLIVDGEVDSITANVVLFNTQSLLWINGVQIESGRDVNTLLNVGETSLEFFIVADNGTHETYSLTVSRSKPDEYFVIGSGSGTAIPMTYHVRENHQKFISLAGYSNDITYNQTLSSGLHIENFDVNYRYAIEQWNIRTLPANGKLYEATNEIIDLPYNASDPDALLYIPNKNYTGPDSFSFSIQDSTGESELSLISLIVATNASVPSGIAPLPAIFHTVAPTPATTGNVENKDWYIDNSHPSATDELQVNELEPRQGTPETPRLTLPPSYVIIPAGANLFISGGVETPYELQINQWHRWSLKGTAEAPVYVLGANDSPNKPVIEHNSTELHLEAEYAIIDGLHFKGLVVQTNNLGYENGNIVIRHSIIDGRHNPTNLSLDSHIGLSMDIGDTKVLYDMAIRNAGDKVPRETNEDNVPGIQINNANGFWIIDSLIHDNEDSGIEINAETATNIHIGRNKIHSNFENALNIQAFDDLVFIENDVWDHRVIDQLSIQSDGAAIRVTQEISSIKTTLATFSRNRIWEANIGIRHQGQQLWVNDNLFWNLHHNINNPSASYAIDISHPQEVNSATHIINNTFSQINNGIQTTGINNYNINDFLIKGNIFGDFNESSIEKIHYTVSAHHTENTITDYNLYAHPLKIQWGSDAISDTLNITTYREKTLNADASLNDVDPLFTDVTQFNLQPENTSPAIGANIEHDIYTLFQAQYGRFLNYDRDENQRPINATWDIGAYEQ